MYKAIKEKIMTVLGTHPTPRPAMVIVGVDADVMIGRASGGGLDPSEFDAQGVHAYEGPPMDDEIFAGLVADTCDQIIGETITPFTTYSSRQSTIMQALRARQAAAAAAAAAQALSQIQTMPLQVQVGPTPTPDANSYDDGSDDGSDGYPPISSSQSDAVAAFRNGVDPFADDLLGYHEVEITDDIPDRDGDGRVTASRHGGAGYLSEWPLGGKSE